ncbi:hypothetical protein CRE_24913 [Caenorhabditis remanei]|uniref:Uncharacterized protein n=1 Tax=Caenorhabditis remanei TaxID=31234 RepID=E3MI06_CAERE|nr:hypothetical protein CRE_24913 [Caenorhabditis remanei]
MDPTEMQYQVLAMMIKARVDIVVDTLLLLVAIQNVIIPFSARPNFRRPLPFFNIPISSLFVPCRPFF